MKSSTIGRGLVRPRLVRPRQLGEWNPKDDACAYRVFVLSIMFGWLKKPFDAMDPELR